MREGGRRGVREREGVDGQMDHWTDLPMDGQTNECMDNVYLLYRKDRRDWRV